MPPLESISPPFFGGSMKELKSHMEHVKRAEEAMEARRFTEAKSLYFRAAHILLGKEASAIPLQATKNGGGKQWDIYSYMDPPIRMSLLNCYNNMGVCSMVLFEMVEALEWLEEARFLAFTSRFCHTKPLFEWVRYNIDIPEVTRLRVLTLATASSIFRRIGNTGTALDRRWNMCIQGLGPRHVTPEVVEISDPKELNELTQLRHPDPSLTHRLEVQFSELQVLGSWKKLKLMNKGGMKARLAFSSFIWNSKLYVGGGALEKKGPWLRDLWCLDLEKLDKWRQLPSYPVSEQYTGVWLRWRFSIRDNKAYLVTGKPEVDYFDLITEKWGSIMTTYKRTEADKEAGMNAQWVFPMSNILNSTQEVVGDILYLFGGTHGDCIIGTNLFMQLNLKTMEWSRLSGTLKPDEFADYSCPGPRKTPSSWVDRDQKRIYLIFGECDRSAGISKGDRHAWEHGYAYEDFWSWDLKAKEWRMERFIGNVPCPRSEAACTYNPSMDKTVIFGGYSPFIPTKFGNNFFPFSYYADTFMYFPPPPSSGQDIFPPPSGKWKHVLTRGFPTYRAQSQLHTDPATGKMYLFGGYVNTDCVPSRKTCNSRTFGDLWQLRVDVPGGFFDEKDVDLEEERKTALAGPWQRCFTCGSTGRWKKCGGSCKGHAFFCDSDCLREGWKEHKLMHGCKKVG